MFFPDEMLRRRYVVDSFDGGEIQRSLESEETIKATKIEPRKSTLERLPENDRSRVEMAISTESKLRTADPSKEPPVLADRVVFEDEEYEVGTVEHFSTLLPHYEVTLLRKKE